MNKKQAFALLDLIQQETKASAEALQIGNNEWVVRIDGYLFCWSENDWYAVVRPKLPAGKKRKQAAAV